MTAWRLLTVTSRRLWAFEPAAPNQGVRLGYLLQ
jgi:hypothetical protein